MYKIKYIKTGHIFILPEQTAQELKNKFPEEYQILEKNGKKFNDSKRKSPLSNKEKSVRSRVVEEA